MSQEGSASACQACGQVPDSGEVFCTRCGTRLPATGASNLSPVAPPPRTTASRNPPPPLRPFRTWASRRKVAAVSALAVLLAMISLAASPGSFDEQLPSGTDRSDAAGESEAPAAAPSAPPTDVASAAVPSASPTDVASASAPVDGTDAVTDWLALVTPLECYDSDTPLEVKKVVEGDVSGDGTPEVFVAYACAASTSSWPEQLEGFTRGADGEWVKMVRLYQTDDADSDRGLRLRELRVSPGVVRMTASAWSSQAPNCCADITIRQTFRLRGDEWRAEPRRYTSA